MGLKKYVFSFEEGDGQNKKLLGGKGANLCEMTQIGLHVPPGFVISTEACLTYLDQKEKDLQKGLIDEIRQAMAALEKKTGKGFGDPDKPLLVSVRSGAAMSMPGMMDTILNLGLNDETAEGLIKQTKNKRFVYDVYRRLIQLFGSIGLGLDDEAFSEIFNKIKKKYKVKDDTDLDEKALKETCDEFRDLIQKKTGKPFPQDPYEQESLFLRIPMSSSRSPLRPSLNHGWASAP